MPGSGASVAVSVERFFEFSLLGLVASGYMAVAGSGYLDLPTIVLTAIGLVLRGLSIYGVVRLEISERTSTFATLAYSGFYLFDYLVLSREFLSATVHLVFFLAVMKILTAKSSRDHLYTSVIAFLELVAAAILSINFNFFIFLTLYLLFAMAALMSGEIRRSMHRSASTARRGSKRFHPRLAVLTVSVTAGILVLTGGLFFVLPRTADAAFARLIPRRFHLPGFSNQLTLGAFGELKTTTRPMMHIHVWGDAPPGLKWRGGALAEFDGRRWSNNTRYLNERVPVISGEATLVPPAARQFGRHLNYEVSFDELETDALFFAGLPESVSVRRDSVYRGPGGTYRLGRAPEPSFRYSAYSRLEDPPETGRPPVAAPVLPLAERERYLQVPQLDPRIAELSRSVAGNAVGDLFRTRKIEAYLRTEFGYTLKLPAHPVADPLAYFLFTRKQGHCEYFASAMAVMLRTLGIPARMATGFQNGVFNPMTEMWLVRASDAHTWVEAWIGGYGWATFDPTPPDPNPPGMALMTKLGLYLDTAETFWQQWIVGYDAGQQGSLADRFGQGAVRAGLHWFDSLSLLDSGWETRMLAWFQRWWQRLAILGGLTLWFWLLGPPLVRLLRLRHRVQRARRGQASIGDATLLYERMLRVLKRHGHQKPVWFTPGEFAASLGGTPLSGPVREFTETYNELRFGGRTEVAPRLTSLLEQLERQQRSRS
jgi:protein-glutamine gamma-glutamyltransferase